MADEVSDDKAAASFEETPKGWQQRWTAEFASARTPELKAWHEKGEKAVKRFKDENTTESDADTSNLCLFTANTQTLRALLFGKTPQVDVSRRFADATDDVARVASIVLERTLNSDIESPRDGYTQALEHALDDRLVPGGGNVRLRYSAEWGKSEEVPAQTHPETGEEMAPAIPPQDVKDSEDVAVEYVYWKDNLWSPAKVFENVTWWAFRAQMDRVALGKRFGKEKAAKVQLNSKEEKEGQPSPPWARADVWEIWDKDSKNVFWFVEGMEEVLDMKEDPLGLEGFWPMPRPMFANLTTSAFVPIPDYKFAQDLYREIDDFSARIKGLQECVRAAGVYDSACTGLSDLMTSKGNVLLPVPNWMLIGGKAGVDNSIAWLPLEQIVAALDKLRELRTESIGLLFQVTGMSDIMRGQATAGATATEQSIKAKFASVRVQSLQDEFARFASDIQRLKAEIMARHFDVNTLLERSNIMRTPDAQLAPQAVQMLKEDFRQYRVVVKPEAVNLTDYAQVKSERTEFLQAAAGFLTAAMPLAQAFPGSMVMSLQLLQWATAGFRGAATVEGVLDTSIAQAQQAQKQAQQQPPQPPPPDPKLQAQQLKGQQELAKGQQDFQHGLVHMQAEVQADNQKQAQKAKWAVLQSAAQERAKVVQGIDAVTHPPGVE